MNLPSERHKWRTAIIGFGRIAAGYAEDPLTSKYFPYSTHAQVLKTHPCFDWQGVVDPFDGARQYACDQWRVPFITSELSELLNVLEPEVLVISTPPDKRIFKLSEIPCLRAVVVEKPLGIDYGTAKALVEECSELGVLLQVNLLRRADFVFRELAAGELERRIGAVQGAFVVYGNGLRNNGTHMIDLIRMLLGEIVAVQAVGGTSGDFAGGIAGDVQFPFIVTIESGVSVMFQPLCFQHYRENGLDIWGEKGRLSIMLEGLSVMVFNKEKSRAITNEFEVASDKPLSIEPTIGNALYRLYDNLNDGLVKTSDLWSSGESALRTTLIVESIICSFQEGGRVIHLENSW